MAVFDLDFDPNSVDTTDQYELLPAGVYQAQITESEIVDTKSGAGKILKLTWELGPGGFEGRKVWQNINFLNPSPKAQEIGQIELARILKAIGAGPLRDTEELHFKPCLITLKVKPAEGQYSAKNEVSRVNPIDGPMPAAAPAVRQATTRAPAAAAAQPRAAATGGAPWRR